MAFHWSPSDSKVSRTLLSILADLNDALILMVLVRTPNSNSSRFLTNPLGTVPNAPIIIGITVTFMFHNFLVLRQPASTCVSLFVFFDFIIIIIIIIIVVAVAVVKRILMLSHQISQWCTVFAVLTVKFGFLSSVSSTEKDIDTRLTKAWTAIDRLSIIWKSDLTDKMKHSFFQAAVVSILLYGCTTWTLTKRLEKKLDGNYTRMLRAILNNSRRQNSTKHQLYGHLPPITKTIQARRTRDAGHCWRSRDEAISDVLLWTPHIWPGKSRTTSWNIHSAAIRGYGMWP